MGEILKNRNLISMHCASLKREKNLRKLMALFWDFIRVLGLENHKAQSSGKLMWKKNDGTLDVKGGAEDVIPP